MGRLYAYFGHKSFTGTRLVLIVVMVVLLHLTVKAIRMISEWLINKSRAPKSPLDFVTHQPKFVTLIQLIANGVTFAIYFIAIGLVLEELGVNLTGYLASASIIVMVRRIPAEIPRNVAVPRRSMSTSAPSPTPAIEIVPQRTSAFDRRSFSSDQLFKRSAR